MGLYGNTDSGVMVLYSGATWVTGANLGRYLGVAYGTDDPADEMGRVDYLVRWGSSDGVQYVPSEDTINYKSAVERNTDKLGAMRRMDRAGVPVVPYTTDEAQAAEWVAGGNVVFGRSENHRGGQDIDLYDPDEVSTWRAQSVVEGNDFYTKGVDVDTEYRVHVYQGDVVTVREKEQRDDPDPDDVVADDEWVRNYENGYRFVYPDERPPALGQASAACHALGLDMGAVDMALDTDGLPWVFEVNTAASLDKPSLERYAKRLADTLGLSAEYVAEHGGFRATNMYDDAASDDFDDVSWDESDVDDMWPCTVVSDGDGGSSDSPDAAATDDTPAASDAEPHVRVIEAGSGDVHSVPASVLRDPDAASEATAVSEVLDDEGALGRLRGLV
jgi:hypothetical protein